MKKTTLICAAAALLCALPNGESAAQDAPYVPGAVSPLPDLRGFWKIQDASEPSSQPKTVEIIRMPGSVTRYVARFAKAKNKCKAGKAARPMYLKGLKVGDASAFFRVGDEAIPGNMTLIADMVRCPTKAFIKACRGRGKGTWVAKYGAVLETDPQTGKVTRIKGNYKTEYFDVKGKRPNTRCIRNKSKDRVRDVTLTRIK